MCFCIMNESPPTKYLSHSLHDVSSLVSFPLQEIKTTSNESFVFIDPFSHQLDRQRSTTSLQLIDGWDEEGADHVESSSQPDKSLAVISTPNIDQQTRWVWGPELITGPEAEKVYCEVLYSLLHDIKRPENNNRIDQVYFDYLKRSFQFTDAKHDEFLSSARQRTPPVVSLKLDILQARNLKEIKSGPGLSNAYCSVRISSDRQKCQDTSMKSKIFDPIWNETMNFVVSDLNEDILQLEIWDYQRDKTRRLCCFLQICDSYLKKISNNNGNKPDHKFLGLLNVKLKSIPISGVERCWYQLEDTLDKTKVKKRGEIFLNLTFSISATDTAESYVHYERLLKIFVQHELCADLEWRGVLPDSAAVILRRFANHRGLRPSVTDVCCWSVYATTLPKRTLDFVELLNLFRRLRMAITDGKLPEEELINIFWMASNSFVVAALSSLRHLRNNPELSTKPEQLSVLLECLKELDTLGFISDRPEFSELRMRIVESVTMGAADHFSRIIGGRKPGPMCAPDRLKNAIRICQSLMIDLEKVLNVYHQIFERVWQIPAFNIVYIYYDGQLTSTFKPVVDSVIKTLKSIQASNHQIVSLALEASGEISQTLQNGHAKQNEVDTIAPRLSMGTSLFELYLCLQKFRKLSDSLPIFDRSERKKLAPIETWFESVADRWLDFALSKAMICIGKAVQLDNLQTVDNIVKHSTSAVDAVSIFYSMKIFREKLVCPGENGDLSFFIKIMDEVRNSATIYAEAIRLKLERLHCRSPTTGPDSQPFFISLEICSAINSVLHVQQSIHPLAEEIGCVRLRDAVVQHEVTNGLLSPTQETLKENAIKDVNEKLDEIFHAIARKLEIEVTRLINNAMESEFGTRQTDDLNSYISNQLLALYSNLDSDVFFRVLNIIYRHILQSFLNIIEQEVQKKRKPVWFRKWKELLDIIDIFFQHNPHANVDEENETLTKICWLLKLHGTDTGDLIRLYQLDRLKQTFESSKDVGLGSISVWAIFIEDTLKINVLNARHLKAMNAHGSADPYIKVKLLPIQHFPDPAKLKSKVHKHTLFPLFEKSFTCPVPKSLQTIQECCIHFIMKNRNIIGANEVMGENILGFQQIPRVDSSVDMNDLDQMILPLTTYYLEKESEYLNVLEDRTWDKVAKAFAKKEKKRMSKMHRKKNKVLGSNISQSVAMRA